MTNPRLDPSFPVDPSSRTLQITWDVGAEPGSHLPDAYFAAGHGPAEGTSVVSVRLIAPRVLEVTLNDRAGTLKDFNLIFPDRRGYLKCSHAGMNDTYSLTANVKWVGEPPGHLVQSFTERVSRGPI